jgi:two-component system, NarL family, sensor histidine kinase DesK
MPAMAELRKPPRAIATFWLIYLAFVFLEPYVARSGPAVWLISGLSIALFLPLYYGAFIAADTNPRRAVKLAWGMVALGLALVPINIGGSAYVIFAASVAGFAFRRRQPAAVFVVTLSALLLVTIWTTRRPLEYSMLFQPVIVLMVGFGNLLVAEEHRRNRVVQRAQEEVEEMAKVAERERIARDLHDLLGHTLSVIVLKSELASRLADIDPRGAAAEIRDVEQVARTALTEVRHAVEGYRSRGLSGEVAGAQQALAAAGITLERWIEPVVLTPRRESVLALAVREAVTNVIRHARAGRCRITLSGSGGTAVLRIADDGSGGALVEGAGLLGMKERVQAVGGSVVIESTADGLTVSVSMPLEDAVEVPA